MLKIIAGSSHPTFAQSICDALDVDLTFSKTHHFPDNEIDVEVCESCIDSTVFIVQSLALNPSDYIIELLMLADAARRQGAKEIHAIIPYLAYMRQDKALNEHAYSGKVIANLISNVFDSVILVEPHTQQVAGFFSIPVHEVNTSALVAKHLIARGLNDVTLVSPDAGGLKRVEAARPTDSSAIAVVQKKRTANNEVVTEGVIGEVAGKDCVLIDDVMSTGATLMQAAQILKQNGAQSIRAYVTHCIMEVAEMDFSESALEELIVFDTVSQLSEKITKLSVQSEIVAIITRLIGEDRHVKRNETR